MNRGILESLVSISSKISKIAAPRAWNRETYRSYVGTGHDRGNKEFGNFRRNGG